MQDRKFDVVVIGAGIQGAGVAQAAAAKGWSVAVLEQYGQAAMGTSSKSSKLIHGGLRYLETFQFGLVRECLREKKLLLNLAPGLVKKNRFVVPVYQFSQRSAFVIHLGLLLYRLIGGATVAPIKRYPRAQWSRFPNLKKDKLVALLEYSDAQTDDQQLTEAVLRSAQTMGAQIEFNFELQEAHKTDNEYILTSTNHQIIRAKFIVNAAGPWVNQVAARILSSTGKTPPDMPMDLVQGAHIVINKPALEQCYYFESPDDRRAVFVLPWHGNILVGTTETLFTGDPAECAATDEEVQYLLNVFNTYFPSDAVDERAIQTKFAGLRVLPKNELNPNRRSRDTLYCHSDNFTHYLAVYGGKLTSYRATAEKVIKIIQPSLPVKKEKGNTRKLMLE